VTGRDPLAEVAAAAAPLLGVEPAGDADPEFGAVADPARAFTLEAVREGYLLHYGEPRAIRIDDPDLALLAGDTLYALGLARIAEAGDLEAVAELADLISVCATAHAEGRPELAEAAWGASVEALTSGGPGARAVRESPVPEG
jgi:hypothetical protein